MVRLTICALLAALLAGGAAAFPSSDVRRAEEAHDAVLVRQGDAYANARVAAYVASVGRRLAARTAEAPEDWTFTVLDEGDIGAFAHPGGYVYVTRGLLTFAISEAELAAVLAHQMAHVVLGQATVRTDEPVAPGQGLSRGALLDGLVGRRIAGPETPVPTPLPERGPTGARPEPTTVEETRAARLAVALLAGAGWPKESYGVMLTRLSRQAALDARLGLGNRVWAVGRDSAARGAIAAAAVEIAARLADRADADAGVAQHLAILDGLTFGPGPDRGRVEGGAYVHPQLRFAFDVPEGFRVDTSSAQIVAEGPGGARIVLDVTDSAGVRLRSYLRDAWAPQLTRTVTAGFIYDLTQTRIGGFEAASAFLPYEDDTGAKVAQLVVIRTDERVYRLRAIAPAEDLAASLDMEAAIRSFRALSAAEAAAWRPHTLRVHRVRQGDSVNLFAASMPDRALAEERWRLLNGLEGRRVPFVGSRVKMVVE